jgi:actin related protein 2/3 complex subunit 3
METSFLSRIMSRGQNRGVGLKVNVLQSVMNIALDTNFSIPGDASFPLNQAFEAPADRNQAEVLRQYIMQMRQELATRLLNRLYADGTGVPSKWWLSFTKRKFMGKAL